MANDQGEQIKIWTPQCVIDFPFVFEPRLRKKAKPGETPKYSCSLLFDTAAQQDPNYAKMKTAANKFAVEAFTEAKLREWMELGKFKSPFLDGNKFPENSGWSGKTAIRVSTVVKPGIVDAQVRPIIDPLDLYSGAIVIATLGLYSYDTDGNRGVSFGLRNIQKVGEGVRLYEGGRSKPDDDFVPLGEVAQAAGGDPGALF